jgi:hypothetical protein
MTQNIVVDVITVIFFINIGIVKHVDNNAGKHCTQQREVSHPSSLFLQPTNQGGECTPLGILPGIFPSNRDDFYQKFLKVK